MQLTTIGQSSLSFFFLKILALRTLKNNLIKTKRYRSTLRKELMKFAFHNPC